MKKIFILFMVIVMIALMIISAIGPALRGF